jgi:hypothetical protein
VTVFRYPRHCALVAAAAIVLVILPRIPVPLRVDRLMLLFAASGVLYSATLLLALAAPVSCYARLGFAGISAISGAVSPYVGLALASLLGVRGTAALPAAFALAAAAGAAAYFLVVRALFLRTLTLRAFWRTLALCVAATLLAYAIAVLAWPAPYGKYLAPLLDALPAVGWWLGFSFSLYLAERALPDREA